MASSLPHCTRHAVPYEDLRAACGLNVNVTTPNEGNTPQMQLAKLQYELHITQNLY
jgi:hypothetical protein